jgi:hypothetical protein
MQKLLLLSIMIMSLVLPIRASQEKERLVGMKKTIKWMALYCVFYLFGLLYIYPRLEGY